MKGWIKLNQRSINKNINGSGLETQPIIFNSSSPEYDCFKIAKTHSFIILDGLQVRSLRLKYCQNIIIRNCDICFLWMWRCNNITVENCSIFHFEQYGCHSNLYSTNSLLENNMKKLDQNLYEKNIWGVFFFSLILLSLIIFLATVYNFLFYLFYAVLIIGVLSFSVIRFQYIRRKLKKNNNPCLFENTSFLSPLNSLKDYCSICKWKVNNCFIMRKMGSSENIK